MVHKHKVRIASSDNGAPVYKWITAHSVDALNDRIVQTYIESGRIGEFMKLPKGRDAVEELPNRRTTKTFSAYVEEWLTVYKAQSLKPTTLRGYRSMMSAHLTAAFGSMQLADITTADVQRFLNERSHLSRKTLKLMLDFMGQVFKDAIEDGFMEHDPTASRKLVIPSTRKKEREAISMEEFQDILANLSKLQAQDRRLMALLMLTGMRRGEALGLQWNDIDWEKGLIHVRRNVTFAGNQPHIGMPKTEKGTRQIPIVGMLREYLEPGRGRGEVHHRRRRTHYRDDLQADFPADCQNHRPAWRDAACVPSQLPDLCADRCDGYQDAAGHRRTRGYPDHHEPLCASAERQDRGDRKARDRPVCAKNVQSRKFGKP